MLERFPELHLRITHYLCISSPNTTVHLEKGTQVTWLSPPVPSKTIHILLTPSSGHVQICIYLGFKNWGTGAPCCPGWWMIQLSTKLLWKTKQISCRCTGQVTVWQRPKLGQTPSGLKVAVLPRQSGVTLFQARQDEGPQLDGLKAVYWERQLLGDPRGQSVRKIYWDKSKQVVHWWNCFPVCKGNKHTVMETKAFDSG